MKRIINAIRDFLYNITDYGLIISVIVIMVVILGWRFDILFNRGIDKEVIEDLPVIVEQDDENAPKESEKPQESKEEPSEQGGNGLIATVTIPAGSFPSAIGDILVSSNLIEDKTEFLNRSVELGLDTRLRSGTYEFEVGTSLDNIIKTIANAQ